MRQDQNNFSCPCGKSYMSYPALHTHIKRKHDGKAPGKVQVPKLTIKRGRPAIGLHKVQPTEKTHDLKILSMLETAIVDVSDIFSSSCILQRNEQPHLHFKQAHPCLIQESREKGIPSALAKFVQEFCMHFKPNLTQRVVYFVSCLLWWLERTKQEFQLSLMEDFLKHGYEEECAIHKLEVFSEDNDTRLFKLVIVTLSNWLYYNGYTSETLEENT